MKLRCPYCKEVMGPKINSTCPRCGKTMTIPDHLKNTKYRERKKAKERIAREAERKKAAMAMTPDLRLGRKPSVALLILAAMAVIGGGLLAKSASRLAITSGQGRINRAVKELSIIQTALDQLKENCGRYPTTEEGLDALVENPGIRKWDGRYVNLIVKDPWKNEYIYSCEDDIVILHSSGPDGIAGTADDVLPELRLTTK
ncbi:type II secretion system protein GspG [Verrucomicrobiota bacterium]